MIDVETGLARAQSEAQIVPAETANVITKGCNVDKIKCVQIGITKQEIVH